MSEEEIIVAPDPALEVESEGPFDEQRARTALEKKNRENAALRARLKEAEPLVNKARELEEAQKTESQRATEALTAAETRALKAEAELLRRDVASEKGLTAAQAKRLHGTTREELLADADDYLASLPTPQVPPPPTGQRTPVEALRPGALPNVPPASIAERIAEAEKAGNVGASIELKQQAAAELRTQAANGRR